MKVLKFHIGRGGRFFNQGYVTFEGFESLKDGDYNFNDYFPTESGEGYVDSNGNEVDYLCNDDGTGYIDDDGDYDKTVWKNENELNAKEVNALIREFDGAYGEDAKEVVNKYYSEYID